jgi:hypothetical protein
VNAPSSARDLKELARLLRGLASRLDYLGDALDETKAAELLERTSPHADELARVVVEDFSADRFEPNGSG